MYSDIDVGITRVEGIALSSPYGNSKSLGQPLGVKSVGFIRLHTNIGIIGVGETYAGVYAPELIAPAASFLENYVVGRQVGDDALAGNLAGIPFIGRNGLLRSVASAIECALWDLRGKILGRPAYALVGAGERSSVPVYASSGSAVFSPDEIVRDVHEIVTRGYRAYKMRVGFQSWDVDILRVEAARHALQGCDLMVDAIMGTLRPAWSAEKAIACAADLAPFGLSWLEEPVHPENVSGLAEVRRAGLVPVAAGEAYSGEGEYRSVLDQDAVDVLQFDATHSGGIASCVDLARRAASLGLRSAVHVWGSAAAIAANAQIALAVPEVEILEIPMVPLELTERMWLEPPRIVDGVWHAGDAPGLGVALDDELIEQYPLLPGSGYRIPKT